MSRLISQIRFFLAAPVLLVTLFAAVPMQIGVQEAVAAMREGRFSDAVGLLKPFLDSGSQDPRIWTLNGVALSNSGQKPEALASYLKALEYAPEYLPALQGAAEIEFQSGDANSEPRLQKIVSLQPDNGTAHAMLAMISYDRQECSSAVTHFRAAGGELDRNPASLWPFGHCLLLEGHPDEAASVFRRLLERHPGDERVAYGLGVALFEAREYTEAVEVLRPMMETERPDSDLLRLIADAYEANHETPQALEALKKAVALYPSEEQHYVALADLCMEHGSFELGLEVLDAGMANLPNSAAIRSMRGVIYAQLGKYDQAEVEFDEASRLAPSARSAEMGRTLTLQESGRVEESIRLLRDRLRDDPQDAASNYLLAQALVKKGIKPGEAEFEEAKNALEQAIESDPDVAPPRVELGKLLAKAGEMEAAAKHLERAVEIDPTDRTATYQLMRALRRTGRADEAAELLKTLRTQLDEGMEDDVKTNRYRLIKAGEE